MGGGAQYPANVARECAGERRREGEETSGAADNAAQARGLASNSL